MAQWCLPQIYSEPHEPVCWLDPRDETTKSWIHVLLQEVVHSDGVDYFTAQHDLLGAPMPLTGIKMIHDRARPGVLVCLLCAASGGRRAIPTMAHMITHIQRHHSGRWVETKLAKFFRSQDPDDFATISHPGSRGGGASNARRDIEAARRGSNEIWDNALNTFKLKSGSGDWCGAHMRATTPAKSFHRIAYHCIITVRCTITRRLRANQHSGLIHVCWSVTG